jgi:signal transduction histidine kinase
VDKFRQEYGLPARFEDNGGQIRLDEGLQTSLFRALRELLMNAVKHSQAENVHVALKTEDGQVSLSVTDDGIGFDPADLDAPRQRPQGFGLFSIRERLGYLGGSVETTAEPGKGARITLRVPARERNSATEPIESG